MSYSSPSWLILVLILFHLAYLVPGEPQDFKVVRVTSNSIDLEWKAPRREEQSQSSNNIKGYEIHYFKVNQSPQSGGSGVLNGGGGGGGDSSGIDDAMAAKSAEDTQIFKRKTNDVKKLKYTLTDLEPNSLYKIQIFAYNKRGDGQRSSPLLVTTLDEGPGRPENIRSEIRGEALIIRWDPPPLSSKAGSPPSKLDGYLVHFDRERYEVEPQATQIIFQKNKWDYDRQYEFKIAAKSGATSSANKTVYGQEAIYHISTHTNQSKIVIQLDKLTSRSVLIRWNPIHFSSSSSIQSSRGATRPMYKLEYYSKSRPDQVRTHESLNATELQLVNLTPDTDYVVQLVAYAASQTSEPSARHFRTLANDLEAPRGLEVIRFEPDKISVQWEAAPPGTVKAYKIYFKEVQSGGGGANSDDEYEGEGDEASDEWNVIVHNETIITDTILKDLTINRDYAIKLTAVDFANNEGPETPAHYVYRFNPNIDQPQPPPHINENYPNNNNNVDTQQGQISDRVGSPQDVEIIDYTSSSVKFAWMPPSSLSGSLPIKHFLLSYVDKPKTYRESNGSLVTYVKGIGMSIKVPARDDPTIKITWLVTALAPFTDYEFNISSVGGSNMLDLQSPPVPRHIKTRSARPSRVDAPQVRDIYSDHTALIKLGNASARNGPISKYWLVIVPVDPLHKQLGGVGSDNKAAAASSASMQAEFVDVAALFKYSLFNTTHSNESAYITAEFASEYWPQEYMVGVGEALKYGRFVNRKLSPNVDYRAFTIAFTQETPVENTVGSNQQQQQQQQPQQKQPNMVLLADVVPGRPSLLFLEGDLFTYSPYSEIFNTRMAFETQQDRISAQSGFGLSDYVVNIILATVAVGIFICLFGLVVFCLLNVMNKRSKRKATQLANGNQAQGQHQRLLNGNGLRSPQGNGVIVRANGGSSTSSSTTARDNNLSSSVGRLMDTHVTSKNGNHIQTTLMRSSIPNNTNTTNKSSSQQMFELTQTPLSQSAAAAALTAAIISSSSSSSSTTASPTTALLSCSVNNNNHHNTNMGTNHQLQLIQNNSGSQSSSNTNTNTTNNTQVGILAGIGGGSSASASNNGLLTTVGSPMRQVGIVGGFQAPPMQESLYTSIEVTQKLLQQQQNFSSSTGNGGSNPYDNHLMSMMMLMNGNTSSSSHNATNNNINNNSTFSTGGTLNRSNHMNTMSHHQQHQQQLHQHLQQFSLPAHYDPIEYRRVHYPTSALAAHPPIPTDELFQHVERLKAHENTLFSQEYDSIDPGQQFTWETAVTDINRQKNRYANVIVYDHSRVILSRLNNNNNNEIMTTSSGHLFGNDSDTSTPSSDYINASFCDGYRKSAAYIATQGPLPATYGDFWRMVWEQGSSTVVMMTKLEERQRLKCDQYYPSKGTEVYDNCMQVTLVDHTELAAYSIRTFVIAPVNTYAQLQISANSHNMNFEMRREVKHFQFTAWPDHGVPDHPTQFLMFVRRVRNSNPTDSGPMVVHCSAGVGRTGCFIVIDTMLERLRASEKTIDIYGHVTCLRAQRNFMVQTEEQYIFCYDAILEASQSGLTEVPVRSLYAHLQRLLQIAPTSDLHSGGGGVGSDPSTQLTEMEIEYKRLSNIKAPHSKFHAANLPANKFKNRLVNILPYEATRVVLQCLPNQPESTGSDYINANYIDGYKYRRAYIATQAPLQETIDDFWRMLWEHNSTIVVMLTKLREMGREKCAQYWPSERSIRYQYFVVDPIAEYNMSQYILREFKVTDARDGQSRTIRQFQFVDWPEQGVPKTGESIIELIGQVHKTKEQFGQVGPITVHCSAGVGRTGVFITLGIVLERMRFEGCIDVFNTVKVLRAQRPAMVQTEDQYQFCYRAALEYLGSLETYE